jgi:hypothetical protein
MSPAGQQAYEILRWAYANKEQVAEAQQRMKALALEGDNANDNDVTDAGTMLSRLAGSLAPAGRSISDQMQEGSVGQ